MSLRAQSLKDIFTFTRASTATYFDINGVLTTAGVDEPRIDYDPVALTCRGLLIEEQRTNLILNSATFVTQNVTVTNVPHTLSFYGTGTIALTGTASPEVSLVGTGASTRVSLTFTPAAGTLTLTLTGSATLAQLEAGPQATSYIATTTEAVTRATDVCSTTTLEPWFNEEAGTILIEYLMPWENDSDATSRRLLQIDSGTYSDSHLVYVALGNTWLEMYDDTTPVASFDAGDFAKDAVLRAAYAWDSDGAAAAATGSYFSTDSSVTLPSNLVGFRIGGADVVGYEANAYIRKVKFYPRRLSNSELAALVA